MDTTTPERFGDALRYRLVFARQEARRDIEEPYLRSEGSENGGQLAAGGRASHYGHRAWQLREGPNIAVRQAQVAARKGQAARVATRADYELVCLESATCERDRMAIYEAGIPGIGEQLDPHSTQVARQLLLLMNLVYHALSALQEAGEIDLRLVSDQAIVVELLGVAHQPGGSGQRAGGHAAVVGTCASHVATLDQRYRRSQLASSQRGGHTGGSSPNYHNVENLLISQGFRIHARNSHMMVVGR